MLSNEPRSIFVYKFLDKFHLKFEILTLTGIEMMQELSHILFVTSLWSDTWRQSM